MFYLFVQFKVKCIVDSLNIYSVLFFLCYTVCWRMDCCLFVYVGLVYSGTFCVVFFSCIFVDNYLQRYILIWIHLYENILFKGKRGGNIVIKKQLVFTIFPQPSQMLLLLSTRWRCRLTLTFTECLFSLNPAAFIFSWWN